MKALINKLKKLTVFDKLIITVAILSAIFFAYIFFRKSTYITVTVKVGQADVVYETPGVQTWFGQLFYIGMTEKDGLGGIRAQVLQAYSYDTSPTNKAVYMKLKLKVVYNRASDQYTFKGYPVLVGSVLRLYLDRMLIDGLITYVEGMKDLRENKTIIVETQIREETPTFPETSGTKDYIANMLHVGEEVKDSLGNTIIKIIDKRVEDAKKVVTTSDGRIVLLSHPLKKDVYLTLQIKTYKINGKYFIFDDIPLYVGSSIPLNTNLVVVYPEITKITVPQ